MKLRSKRTITAVTIILIVIVAAVALTEYQDYNSPLAKCERDAAQGDSQVGFIRVNPSITVEPGTTSGNLTVTLQNNVCAPISGFVITAVQPLLSGVINSSFIEYQGALVAPAHPVPLDKAASGSIILSDISANQSYTLSYVVKLATNVAGWTSQTGAITFTAQS
jgi:hypothetical protein